MVGSSLFEDFLCYRKKKLRIVVAIKYLIIFLTLKRGDNHESENRCHYGEFK